MNIQEVEVEKIRPYERNAKTHTGRQVDQIANSIRQFGFRQPDGTLYLTGKYRSNKNSNLYTLSKSGSSYSGQWSVNSAYPIR